MRKDLFSAYRDVCSKPCPSQKIAWYRTVKHPAKRFYIANQTAYNFVTPMLYNDFTQVDKITNERARKRFYDIHKICVELSKTKEFHNKTAAEIIRKALTMPAPEFYISWETFRRTFRHCKRFGTRYYYQKAVRICSRYTNHKDGKPKDAVYNKKLISQGL